MNPILLVYLPDHIANTIKAAQIAKITKSTRSTHRQSGGGFGCGDS
jgi:hypothetical protein